jgi:hypothetical protein
MPPRGRDATLMDVNHRPTGAHPVRAAIFSASVVTVGLYLALAAAFAFSPTWIGLGVLGISLMAAVSMVVAEAPEPQAVR